MKLTETPNRLINEKSPYLLQHAHNPVDWYPWGDEAFAKANKEDKPVFLSIGYSTCHWCHVMERESFEDEEVAKVLNDDYVSIKVDREERPDIDAIYMSVCQAMTGHGGWPLTVLMTPDKKPFFAGTYFPKHSARGMPGLMDILEQVAQLWKTKKDELVQSGDKITEAVAHSMFAHKEGIVTEDTIHAAFRYYDDSFDPMYGGFGRAPKFPTPHNLMFLLRYWKMTGDKAAVEMVEKTLESMYRGGIYDHIGFGFARYSVDPKWLVPHFEKMLYDNSLLAFAYLEAYQATDKPFYSRVAEEIFTYVLRDMTSPEGAFYSAEDADSEGEEGRFYVWSPEEVSDVLGEQKGARFCRDYDITPGGNFEGKSIPNLIETGIAGDYAEEKHLLFIRREARVHPFKDDKILTSWNGLMIAALAFGSRVLGDSKNNRPQYLTAAEKAAGFILENMRRPEDGRLMARYRDGESAIPAYAEDYAFFIWGLLELFQASFKAEYLETALELNRDLIKFFWDDKQGGFFLYGSDAENLIARPKEIYDGAVPSGNSAAALNFLRLARLTGDSSLEDKARTLLKTFGGSVSEAPAGYSFFLISAWFDLFPAIDVIITGDPDSGQTPEMILTVNSGFAPEMLLTVRRPGTEGDKLAELIPSLKERGSADGQPAAFVCKNFACMPPVNDADKLAEILWGN
ncbi:MAG: thioredoxin domain-containing protein [Firmicutes bacterium HGW-Firmicutes-14]|nr:MAG: thioredoxin domain-containing protein [Firmicutes bacterium HGW-Firmicutes-14]